MCLNVLVVHASKSISLMDVFVLMSILHVRLKELYSVTLQTAGDFFFLVFQSEAFSNRATESEFDSALGNINYLHFCFPAINTTLLILQQTMDKHIEHVDSAAMILFLSQIFSEI